MNPSLKSLSMILNSIIISSAFILISPKVNSHPKCKVDNPFGGWIEMCPHIHVPDNDEGTPLPAPGGVDSSPSRIRICNKTNKKMFLSFANHDGNYNNLIVEGWYNPDPGECITRTLPSINGRPYEGYVYVHGHNSDGRNWGGDDKFICVSSKVFEWSNASYSSCKQRGGRREEANQYYVERSETRTRNFVYSQ